MRGVVRFGARRRGAGVEDRLAHRQAQPRHLRQVREVVPRGPAAGVPRQGAGDFHPLPSARRRRDDGVGDRCVQPGDGGVAASGAGGDAVAGNPPGAGMERAGGKDFRAGGGAGAAGGGAHQVHDVPAESGEAGRLVEGAAVRRAGLDGRDAVLRGPGPGVAEAGGDAAFRPQGLRGAAERVRGGAGAEAADGPVPGARGERAAEVFAGPPDGEGGRAGGGQEEKA